MKKLLGIFILGMIVLSFSMSFVAAETPVDAIKGAVEAVYDGLIEPVLLVIVSEGTDSDAIPELLLTKITFNNTFLFA